MAVMLPRARVRRAWWSGSRTARGRGPTDRSRSRRSRAQLGGGLLPGLGMDAVRAHARTREPGDERLRVGRGSGLSGRAASTVEGPSAAGGGSDELGPGNKQLGRLEDPLSGGRAITRPFPGAPIGQPDDPQHGEDRAARRRVPRGPVFLLVPPWRAMRRRLRIAGRRRSPGVDPGHVRRVHRASGRAGARPPPRRRSRSTGAR